jgi:large subunit ribosomal protein L25
MSEIAIDVQKRELVSKGATKRLRNGGLVPGVVYGAGKEPVSIQINRRKMLEVFRSGVDKNAIFLLRLEGTGQERHAMIREMQVSPTDRQIMHIDFQRILMDQKVVIAVPIELKGTAYGVKNDGAVLDFVTREVEIRCLPTHIPHSIVLDVTPLVVGQHVEAVSLVLPEGVELLEDADRVIVSVAHARHEEGGGEGGEGLLEADKAEPEVAKRGKEKAE